MSGIFFLDWAILAVSLFNTILLLWLGLTVLLNAERRTWGLWLAGGGMLMGGAFFLSHTAILGFGPDYLHHAANFWPCSIVIGVVLSFGKQSRNDGCEHFVRMMEWFCRISACAIISKMKSSA